MVHSYETVRSIFWQLSTKDMLSNITADPDLRAGTQVDLGLGFNFYAPEGALQGARLAAEFNLPLYRNLSGPQLETDFSATVGIQAVF